MRTLKEYVVEDLKNPDRAQAFMKVAFSDYEQDQDLEEFKNALKLVAEAQGGMAKLSERTGLNRQNLYRVFSPKGNPRLDTLMMIIRGLGMKLSVSN